MSGHRLALEQFEVLKPPGLNIEAPPSGLIAQTPDDEQMQIDATAEPQQIEPMGDPLIRPAPAPAEDPEQLSLDALRQDLTHACGRLSGVIAAIEADRVNATTTAIEAAAHRVAEVGIDVIGHILDEGFATEIAGAVAEVATQIPHNSADLHVAEEDHEALVTALAGFAPPWKRSRPRPCATARSCAKRTRQSAMPIMTSCARRLPTRTSIWPMCCDRR